MRESSRTRHLLRRIARWTITTCVIVSPWLFACAESWIFLLVCIPIMAGTAIWLICSISYPASEIRMPAVTISLLIFLGIIYLQAAPMPKAVVKVVSPISADTTQTQLDLFKQMNLTDELPAHDISCDHRMHISTSPPATMMSFYLMCAYVSIFIVMLNTIRTWIHVKNVVHTILGFGFVLAVISIIHSFSGTHNIFWFHTPRYQGNVFGPFTNRNHYAFHMIMIFSLALAMLMASLRFMQFRWKADWREKMADLSTKRASRLALLAFVMIITGASICISLSRGATASLVTAIGIAGVMEAYIRRDSKARHLLLLAIIFIMIAVVIWLGLEPVAMRLGSLREVFAQDPLANSRSVATLDTLKMFGAFPLLGCGFGAFRHTFPMFQSEGIQFGRFLHAHNDWAQILAEGGIIGAVLTAIVLVFFFRSILEKKKYSIHVSWVFARWMSVAFIGVSLHSLVDYSLHKPSNAMMLSALMGIAGAAIHISASDHRAARKPRANDDKTTAKMKMPTRIVMSILLGIIAAVIVLEMDAWRGETAFIRLDYIKKLSRTAKTDKQLETCARTGLREANIIMHSNKGYAETFRETSAVLQEWALSPAINDVFRLQIAEASLSHAAHSVCHAPTDTLGWMVLARSQQLLGQWNDADISMTRSKELTAAANNSDSK